MPVLPHAERLKCPRTIHHQLIEGVDDYQYQPRLKGALQTLPRMPSATADRKVIILDIEHDYPVLLGTLEAPRDRFPLHTRQVGNILFVYLSGRQKRLVIDTPAGGYRLNDGKPLFVDVGLAVTVTSAQEFWGLAADPAEFVETAIRRVIGDYLQSQSSEGLVSLAAQTGDSCQTPLYTAGSTQITQHLIAHLGATSFAGLAIHPSHSTVKIRFNETLDGWIDRNYQKIWGAQGIIDRKFVDLQIAGEPTLSDEQVHESLIKTQRRLHENFYALPFGEAMQQLLARMTEQKESRGGLDPAISEKIKQILPSAKNSSNEKQQADRRERPAPTDTPRTDTQACAALFSARGQ